MYECMAPRTYGSSRDRLLDAAERVLLEGGLAGFGVAAVVEEAGLTKGALFHHFKSKDELLAALVERLAAEVEGQLAKLAAADDDPVGRSLRAQIELTFTLVDDQRERLRTLVLALMQAVSTSPVVAARAREVNQAALARAESEGVSRGDAILVQVALDGYWLNDTGGTLELDASQQKALREALIARTRGPAAASAAPKRKLARKGKRR
jgi:AcrR family transcriptional regulator